MEVLKSLGARIAPVSETANFLEVRGVMLTSLIDRKDRERIVEALNRVVFEHRVVVFRNQGVVAGSDQVAISRWFNPLESTFYKHPMSPHPDVFRVSNDSTVGCTGVGRTGWHVDGSFQPSPFSHALYHIIECPTKGATAFLPLEEFLDGLEPGYRRKLEALSMLSDRRSMHAKPVVYSHPKTGKKTMCFHLGMIRAFVTSDGRIMGREETAQELDELEKAIVQSGLIYTHNWQVGDFIISDNCAVAHEATPETQWPVEEVGLRVRTVLRRSPLPRSFAGPPSLSLALRASLTRHYQVMHRTTTQGWVGR